MKKMLIAASALLALQGCAEPFNARVSRFQQLPVPTGQTFYVQAADPRLQGGIEFQQYASLVTAQLSQQGYRPAPAGATADLVVRFTYSVDRGREKVVSTPGYGYGFGGFGPGWGGFGYPYGGFVGRRGFVYGFYDPFFGGPDVRSYTVFTSELQLQIDRVDTGQRLFEGTARAQSDTDDLTRIVPKLVEAMFTGFPGNSGQTVRITIVPDKPPRATPVR